MYECETCTETFWYEDECDDHMDDCGHWPECETCASTFRTQRACNQHMNDKDHWVPVFECETCDKTFRSQHAARQHMNAVRHWQPKVPCETCGDKFHTQSAADQHMTAKGHFRYYCKACDQRFLNENNLRMHLNSRTHRGTQISCPFCQGRYTTASGVASHIEAGSCPSAPNLNHATILRIIRERDTNGIITNKAIEWHEEKNVKYTATRRAFNGSYWECYLCHKEFDTMTGLNAHINSPVHKGKAYHCPNMARCGKEFSTLAGFFGHLESESCAFMRFEKVQQQVGSLLQGRRAIRFS